MQTAMIAAYALQALLTAAALVTAAAATPRAFALGLHLRCFLALTLTPFALSLITLVIALIAPAAPRPVFFLVPALLSTVTLFALRKTTGMLLSRARTSLEALRISNISFRERRILAAVAAGTLSILSCVVAALLAASGPPIGHDVLVYLAEARHFAAHPAWSTFPTFEEPVGELLKTHPHLFLWQAFIAQGLMAHGDTAGYGNDISARIAIQLTLPLFALGCLMLARSIVRSWTTWLTPIALLSFHGIHWIPNNYGVDAFRAIPLLALVALSLTLFKRNARLTIARGALIGAVAALAAAAHTLNIVAVGLLAAMALALAVAYRVPIRLPFLTAAALPPLLVTIPYLMNWYRYGHLLGMGMGYYFYRNTPLWLLFSEQKHWIHHLGFFEALLVLCQNYGTYPMAIAIAAATTVVIGTLWQRWRYPGAHWRQTAWYRLLPLSAIFLAEVIAPLVPLGEGVSLQGAMISNVRYALPLCSIAAAVLSVVAALLVRRIGPLRSPAFVATTGIAVLLLLGYTSAKLIYLANRSAGIAQPYLDANELRAAHMAAAIPDGANWFTDDYAVSYLAQRMPVYAYSWQSRRLLTARTPSAVLAELKRLNIRFVALDNGDPRWWASTPFIQTVSKLAGVQHSASGRFQFYRLPDLTGP